MVGMAITIRIWFGRRRAALFFGVRRTKKMRKRLSSRTQGCLRGSAPESSPLSPPKALPRSSARPFRMRRPRGVAGRTRRPGAGAARSLRCGVIAEAAHDAYQFVELAVQIGRVWSFFCLTNRTKYRATVGYGNGYQCGSSDCHLAHQR